MKNFKILASLSLVSFFFLIYGYSEKWHFSTVYYLGLTSLVINNISHLWLKKYSKHILGITLFSGLTGLIRFFPFKMSFDLLDISIEIIPLLIFLFFCYTNRESIFDLISSSDNETNTEYTNLKKEFFKKEFENLSESELKNKLKLELTSEARDAINEVLENRKTTR